MITALTAYNVTIPKSFADSKAAVAWAEQDGERYGCCRIIRATATGKRTIWRPAPAEQVETVTVRTAIYTPRRARAA